MRLNNEKIVEEVHFCLVLNNCHRMTTRGICTIIPALLRAGGRPESSQIFLRPCIFLHHSLYPSHMLPVNDPLTTRSSFSSVRPANAQVEPPVSVIASPVDSQPQGLKRKDNLRMELWYVCHGERSDEKSRDHKPEEKAWGRSALHREARSYDRPLTQLGHTQAGRVGTCLRNLLLNRDPEEGPSGFNRVYTSPLIRDVQTAVCLSLKLGDIPLQVVPGLCSCKATLGRIGFANATLMSDADIVCRFPGINLLPRDFPAPNTFREAVDWLADKISQRVLCIGHREGMRQIAGRSVPAASWCAGIFQVDRERRRYELNDLLCHDGTKAELQRCSPSSHSLSMKTQNARSDSNVVRQDIDEAADRVSMLKIVADDKLNKSPASIRRSNSGVTTVTEKTRRDSTKKSAVGRAGTGSRMLTGRQQHPHKLSFADTPRQGLHDAVNKRANRPSVSGADAKSSNLTGKYKDRYVQRAGMRAKPAGSDPCAGRGCRVNFLLQSTSRGGVPLKLPSIPQDALCGSSGVLSFLRPVELCMAQATCKEIASASTSNNLWSTIIDRLPRHIRDKYALVTTQDVKQLAKTEGNFKAVFNSIMHATLCARAARNAKKVRALKTRLGIIHSRRAFVGALQATLAVSLAGCQVAIINSRGPRPEAWASRSNVLCEPSVHNGMRIFTLSSSIKVDLPRSLISVSQLSSMHVIFSVPGRCLPRATVFRKNGLLLSRARLLGKSADNAIALYEVTQDSSNRDNDTVTPPEPRTCALLGVLQSNLKSDCDNDGGDVGFLTFHCPHEMLLYAATHRPQGKDRFEHTWRQSYKDDSAGSKHGLENFTIALGLRTSGIPMWEAARIGVDGHLCGLPAATRSQRAKHTQREPFVLFDLICPAENHADITLHGGPGLPFCTPSTLTGVIENILIADFIAIDTNGDTMWAFALPMVFELSPMSEFRGIGTDGDCDRLMDMSHREVREERRRGVVHEPGVGKVVVELALVESDERVESKGSPARLRCPAGHRWIICTARVELELVYINAWFGTKHGHPSNFIARSSCD